MGRLSVDGDTRATLPGPRQHLSGQWRARADRSEHLGTAAHAADATAPPSSARDTRDMMREHDGVTLGRR